MEFRVWVKGSGFRVWGLGFRVQGSGFGFSGLGFRVSLAFGGGLEKKTTQRHHGQEHEY